MIIKSFTKASKSSMFQYGGKRKFEKDHRYLPLYELTEADRNEMLYKEAKASAELAGAKKGKK